MSDGARIMARQAEMFDKPKRKRVYRAFIYDIEPTRQLFICMCGWQSGWIKALPVREAKRGIPCPKCNEDQKPS